MRAKTNGIRLITLSEGTLLVPTHGFKPITVGESTHEFTQRLVESEEIVLSDVTEEFPTSVGYITEQTHNDEERIGASIEVGSPEVQLRNSLNGKTKSEILEILTAYGEEMSDRTTKDAMIEKVVEIARENNEL